jgi:NAD(P)-dependent dehydrogenase (short-subunit alcohol dehydrogenase family)
LTFPENTAEDELEPSDPTACTLVTGASQGIGKAILLNLAQNSSSVIGLSRHKPQELDDSVWRGLDLSNPADIGRCTSALESVAVRALVLCAVDYGVGQRHPAATTSAEEWQRVIGTNCVGHCILVSALLPKLIATFPGVIINLSSDVALLPGTGRSAYAASKAGLHAMLRAVATENAADRLRVYQLVPMFQVDTEGIRRRRPAGFDFSSYAHPAVIAQLVDRILSAPGSLAPGTYLVRPDGAMLLHPEITQI